MRRLTWAVALAMLVVLAGCSDDTEPRSERSPKTSAAVEETALPDPPAGMEFVGMGSVVVAVPEGMDRQVVRCSMQRKGVDTVDPSCLRLNDYVRASLRSRLTVTFIPEGQANNFDYDESPFTSASVLEGFIADACVGYCVSGRATRLAIPSEDVVLTLIANMEGRAAIRDIINSVTLLPDGYSTVPAIEYGESEPRAARLLTDAGLEAKVADYQGPRYFTGTTPAAGAVVEEASTVTVHVGDG